MVFKQVNSLEAKVEAPIVITSDTGNVANTGLQAGDYTVNQTSMSTRQGSS